MAKSPSDRRSKRRYDRRHGRNEHMKRAIRGRRRRLLRLDPHCHYCGCELYWGNSTIDHVIPLAKGGRSRADNLVLACKACNNKKGAEPCPT